MESPAQMAARLIAALEDLTEEQGTCLRGGNYDQACSTYRRSAPLVQQLAALAGQPGVSDLQPRVMAMLARGEAHAAYREVKMTEITQDIQRIDQARWRTAQVAPAYGQSSGRSLARFEATG